MPKKKPEPKSDFKIEDVDVEPILKEPVPEEKKEIGIDTTSKAKLPSATEKPETSKHDDALEQAYLDFADSLHGTLYKKILNIEIAKEDFDKLNRSGAKVIRKIDKWDWIEKYADFFVYGITTLEILSGAMVQKAKQSKKENPEKIKPENIADDAPLSELGE